ncbi:MAG: hypothetical protein ACFCAD_17260, partial [Pleurocapsa sp.]
ILSVSPLTTKLLYFFSKSVNFQSYFPIICYYLTRYLAAIAIAIAIAIAYSTYQLNSMIFIINSPFFMFGLIALIWLFYVWLKEWHQAVTTYPRI